MSETELRYYEYPKLGLRLKVPESVAWPNYYAELIADFLHDGSPSNGHVLDLGCGSGFLSLAAYRLGATGVTALDTDRMAISATWDNWLESGFPQESLQTELADLRTWTSEASFDLILCNPPQMPSKGGEVADSKNEGGPTGIETAVSAINCAASYLAANGQMLLTCAEFLDVEAIKSAAASVGLNAKIVSGRECQAGPYTLSRISDLEMLGFNFRMASGQPSFTVYLLQLLAVQPG